MSATQPPPSWRMPEGVNTSLWEYAHTDWLAESEDAYFLNHPLFREDVRALDERFLEPGRLIDLGCGVGRLARHFARKGFPVVAVELSHAMLRVLGARARIEGLKVDVLEANLCDLGCLPDASFDYALSMFSTLGMIRGPSARLRALNEAARVLRPGGRLALHAHNVWINAAHWPGRAWMLRQAARQFLGDPGAWDRQMTYRGIPNMEVHLYRWGELRRSLRTAGFAIDEVIPIDTVTARPIPFAWLAHGVRAGGWIVFARRVGCAVSGRLCRSSPGWPVLRITKTLRSGQP